MNTTNNEEWETRLQDKINNLEFGLPEAFFHKPIKDFIRSERSSVRRETVEACKKVIASYLVQENVPNYNDVIYVLLSRLTNLDTISHE